MEPLTEERYPWGWDAPGPFPGRGILISRAYRFPLRTVLVILALVTGLASSVSAAHAGVVTGWDGIQPTGTVGTNIPIIALGYAKADGYLMDASTIKLFIDGALYPRARYYASSRSGTGLYVYCSPSPALIDGPHTFRIEISDTAGKLSAYQWAATVAQAPAASFTAPAQGATVYTGRPRIAMALSDNTPLTPLSVDGQVRASSATGAIVATFGGIGLPQGNSTFTPSVELAPGTYYLTATVRDGAGFARTLVGTAARGFTAVAAPAMSIPPADCLASGCHVKTRHPATTRPCAGCHVAGYHEDTNDCSTDECHGAHAGPVTVTGVVGSCASCHSASYPSVPRHSEASVTSSHTSSCEGCHIESLLTRHATIAGSAYAGQCDLCHASTDPRVKAAIAAGNVSCSACHDRVESHGDLAAIHEPTVTGGPVQALSNHYGSGARSTSDISCNACHSTLNLLNVHGSSWNNCAMCHAAGAPRTTIGAWEGGCQQGACHPITLHDNANSDGNHPPAVPGDCSFCHAGQGSGIDFYAPLECTVVCHQAKVAGVGDASAPVTSVSNPAAYFKNPAQIDLVATDALSAVTGTFYRIDGGGWTFSAGAVSRVTVPAAGVRNLEFYSIDWFGNAEAVRSYIVTFDVSPPVTTDDRASNGGAPVHLTASDVGSGVATTYFSVDGGAFAVYGYFESLLGITNDGGGGAHTVSYYSVDRVGNLEPTVTVNWTIVDATAPTSNLSAAAGTSLYIEATDAYADDPCGVKAIYYRLDGGEWVVTSFPRERPYFTMPRRVDIVVPADGTYQLEYYSVDHADNAEAVRQVAVAIDSVAPTVAANAADTYAGLGYVTVTGSDAGSGVASVSYRLDGYAPVTTQGSSATATLFPPVSGTRTYTFTAWATDKAGNTSALYGPRTIVVSPAPDTTKPAVLLRMAAAPYYAVSTGAMLSTYPGTTMQFKINAQDASSIAAVGYQVDGGSWQEVVGHPQLTYLDVPITLGWGTHTVSFYATDRAGNTADTRSITFDVIP